MSNLFITLRRTMALSIDRVGKRLRNDFYLYIALLLSVVAVADFFTLNLIGGMRNKSFDMMVKYRFRVTPPSKDIVIVDIDEKSLAAMAQEFGRWPWPRQVFGEFVEKVERQRPKALVFDILFSDPDVYNTDSDLYFNDVIAQSTNTWFPMVRLPINADSASVLRTARLPGAAPGPQPDTLSTIGVVLPFLESIQSSGRVGFNNILPDIDGVCRAYPVVHRYHGYAIPSLPFAVARSIAPAHDVPENVLINWRGKPFTYRHISFSDLYTDMRLEKPLRPQDEFRDKIIIIGSTAPSLFDIKVTAVDRQFPGVEILATVIDNLLRRDWLRVPPIPLVYLLVTFLILWITALAFYRRGAGGKLDQFYGLSQVFLIAIAYSAINLLNTYINLTGPVAFGFVFYSIARYYSFATARALDPSVVQLGNAAHEAFGCLVALRFDLPTREEPLIAKLAEHLTKKCREHVSAEWLSGRQRGFWRLFENTIFICWKTQGNLPERLAAIRADADALCASLESVLRDKPMDGALPFSRLRISRAEGSLGERDKEDWRQLMGAALLYNKGEKRS